MNKFYRYFTLMAVMLFFCTDVYAAERWYTIADETGQTVYTTGWKIRKGDEFLTADNKRYEIVLIDGQTAKAKLLGALNLAAYFPVRGMEHDSLWKMGRVYAQEQKKVAIYHTHNDEAYIPSDGTESSDQGEGGILKVGDAFSEALTAEGIQAIHSEANHSPHDDMAYERSRRTVVELLKQQPDAVFDVHRDAAPPEAYQSRIEGKDVTQVQLVVGKYGPTGKEIEEYALQMKAAADQQHPGLVKGIFFAKGGDYNQDLHPKSMLVEVGAHTNSREEAERGIAMFASTVPAVLGVTSANASNVEGKAGVGTQASGVSGSMKSMGWILAFFVLGTMVFMFLSTGSKKEALAKLEHFKEDEFGDLFGSKRKKDKK